MNRLVMPLLGLALLGAAPPQEITVENAPPVVVRTVPEAGATTVDPALNEIRVIFSKPMTNGSWSFITLSKTSFPEVNGMPRYLDDRRTCVLPVKLEPGRIYAVGLNNATLRNFKDANGQPALPYVLVFQTSVNPQAGRRSVP